MSKAKYRAIDLFAGIGGIRMGFDRAFGKEIETVFVSEFDEPARKTYRANFDDPFDISGDITQIPASDVPDSISVSLVFPARHSALQAGEKASKTITKERPEGLFFSIL